MATSTVDMVTELMEKISVNSFDPGSSCWVDITHINNPEHFYARPTVYRRFLNEVQACGDPIRHEDVQMGTTVVYHSKKLNRFVRGRIIFLENNQGTSNTDILAIDYGFIERSLELKNIFKPKNCNIPQLAMHCQLADCKPMGPKWTKREIDAMKFFVGEERAKMFIRDNSSGILTVELINSTPDDIATMLVLTGYSAMGCEHNQISKLTTIETKRLYFTYKVLKQDELLHVRLQTGSNLHSFFVAEKNDYRYFLNEKDNFTYFSRRQKQKSLTAEDLTVDKPVAVLDVYDKYERGLIKEVLPGNRVKVMLVDWGKIIEEPITALRVMSEKFFHYPATAVYCSLTEDQASDSKYRSYLYPGAEFKIKILELGEGHTKPAIVMIMPFNIDYAS